jgi:nucleoside-diphosphate-sugar epimerase
MPRHAFVLGGAGQVGRAVCDNLLSSGWTVTIGSRGQRALPEMIRSGRAKAVVLDREQPDALARALRQGADALVDVTAYHATHGRQLLSVQDRIGALVVISSSSIYRDAAGRTLDEAARGGFPELPDPIHESQPTVAPGEETYSTRKVALENLLLDKALVPLTILRPAAICGPHSLHPREWWFVKRMLDGRGEIPLAYGGRSRFHTTCVGNLAELVRVALETPGDRILNIADPTALTVGEIGAAIARRLDWRGTFRPLDTVGFPAPLGRNPWAVPHPFVLDTRAAVAIGYRPVVTYGDALADVCRDLVRNAAGDWRARFPVLAGYSYELFDYQAEDAAS